jgi:basic membrane protein A
MKRGTVVPILVFLTILAAAAPPPVAAATPLEKVRAAFVYVGPVGDAGWTFGHDQGRREAQKALPWLETAIIESVNEADAERVIETYAQKGFHVIFTTSFGYMDPTLRVAQRYPRTIFMHCSGFKRAPNVGTYFGRMEQAQFLAGIAAGMATRTNTVGYVAPMPIPEVIRILNAFALGVRKVNPTAVVRVVWTGKWFDPPREKEAADGLMDAGADVIETGCDSAAPIQAAEARGKWAMGYDSDSGAYAPQHWLTAPVWDWSVMYRDILTRVKEGTWTSQDWWWDLSTGIVRLAPWGKAVPGEIKKAVEEWQGRILKGEFDVLQGPIRDREGKVVVPAGTTLKGREEVEIRWLVEGVEGAIPR